MNQRKIGTVLRDAAEIGKMYREAPGAAVQHQPASVQVTPREKADGANAERAIGRASTDDDDDYDFEISYSSSTPVQRWFGREILDHSPGAVDLSRLNAGAMLLEDHDPSRKLGVVRSAWIDRDGRGHARVKFSNRQAPQEFRQDVQDGIATLVSFGYQVHEMRLAAIGGDGEEDWLVTKRTDLEISFVGVPADPTVGAGRSYPEPVDSSAADATSKPMTPQAQATTPEAEARGFSKDDLAAAVAAERQRTADITALCREHGCEAIADDLISSGADEAAVLRAVLKAKPEQPVQAATPAERQPEQRPVFTGGIGLTEKEARRWSLMNVLRALAAPHDKRAQDAAGFEREVTVAMGQARGAAYEGFGLPMERMHLSLSDMEQEVLKRQYKRMLRGQTRELTVGTPASAGLLTETDFRPENLIEFLENRLVFGRMGSPVITGLSGDLEFPRVIGSNTPTLLAESGSATLTDMQVGRVTWTPHTVAAATQISRRLLLQSSMDVEMLATNRLLSSVAVTLDSQLLTGDGTGNNILGLTNITGVNAVDFAATNPTYAEVVGLWQAVASDNADIGTAAYVTTPVIYGGLLTTSRDAGSGQFILQPDGRINGNPVEYSNQVATNDLIFGYWSNFAIGMFSGFDITRDSSGDQALQGAMRIIVHVDADGNALNPESFARGNAAIA